MQGQGSVLSSGMVVSNYHKKETIVLCPELT